ncbi:hypothetical protein BJX70DRAFT_204468 [Aspergillus crustosus]
METMTDAENDALMENAMDAIQASVEGIGDGETINPALVETLNIQNPKCSFPSQKMWNAIFINDLRTVESLLEEGLKPMTPTPGSSCGLDMAIRLGHIDIVRAFHRTTQELQEIGLRTLLIAVEANDIPIVSALLDMGMREVFEQDEYMKCVFFGFTCKHGTPEMLDAVDKHGPWFSWKAYKRWCAQLADDAGNNATKAKIAEIGTTYMLKEDIKMLFENPVDLPDACIEDLDIVPLHNLMYHCCIAHPDLPIRTFYWDELQSYKNAHGIETNNLLYATPGLFS